MLPSEDTTCLGMARDGDAHEVTPASVEAFASATIDDPALYLDRGVAPPVYAAAASITSHSRLLTDLLPGEELLAAVHLGQTMRFHEPIRIGSTVSSRATLVEQGGGSFGRTLCLRVEVVDAEHGRLAEAHHRVLVRGGRGAAGSTEGAAEAPRGLRRREPSTTLGEATIHVPEDLSIRYSEASGDLLPIHTDIDIAMRAGFGGLILHGMCTLALCGGAVARFGAGGDPLRLDLLSATFTRPVLVGEDLDVAVARNDAGLIGFSAVQHGRSVLRDGVAVVSDG